ncbi:MAG: bifunctional methylenetetrahydrofolate dehydrogenase/methenyltetrahydrofolate cyclohydrolase FolD [Acetobacter sp.]|nr:bifunctional methylenetetrahydrofolate dehydrogenase/methenyltetrahydrofolate cyclohydrolase FolD [Acetobacter sp.]
MLGDATMINGAAVAGVMTKAMIRDVDNLRKQGITPGLAVVLVGDDPASEVYVRSKIRKTKAVGMNSFCHRLPSDTSQSALLDLIATLNADPDIHGILVQLPLPLHIQRDAVLDAISPEKDVDGFHVLNAGKLAVGRTDGMIPCTPRGCMILLRQVLPSLAGLHAVVIGCSNIVGRPMARLLLNEGCTVVVTHLQTRDVAAEARRADILIVAAGHPGLVRSNWVKPGAVVIDVGINRITTPNGTTIVGDVAFDEVADHAKAITPVPGGVGPMTIACLLQNTLQAAQNTIITKALVS